MTGPWTAWKTKQRFPTLSTAPWKSPTPRFPHSHSVDPCSLSLDLQTTKCARACGARTNARKEQLHRGRDHNLASSFRLISHWNETSVSGSLRIGITTALQAHFWIGKCCPYCKFFECSFSSLFATSERLACPDCRQQRVTALDKPPASAPARCRSATRQTSRGRAAFAPK
jgi:hypothetical protein